MKKLYLFQLPIYGLAPQLFIAALLSLSALTVVSANAQQVEIDPFTTSQALLDAPPTSISTANGAMIYAFRDIEIEHLSGAAGPSTVQVNSGVLTFSVPEGEARVSVVYDGDDSTEFNPIFIPVFNMVSRGHRSFRLQAGTTGNPANVIFEVYTDAANWSRVELTLPVGAMSDHIVNLSELQVAGGSGADLTEVRALIFRIVAENGTVVTVEEFFAETFAVPTPDENNILYVNQNASGGDGSGDSWADAIEELADALKWARREHNSGSPGWDSSDPLQIWVAEGTYKPLYNAADGSYTEDGGRDNAFVMLPNVELYGGFDPDNGIDDLTDDRILPSSGGTEGGGGTILSGDLDDNDNPEDFNNHTENAYHVLLVPVGVNAGLDGVTVQGANGNGSNLIAIYGSNFTRYEGGGVFNAGTLTVRNGRITWNRVEGSTAAALGGGVHSVGSLTLRDVVVDENHSSGGGGGLSIFDSVDLVNVLVAGNTASYGAGILFEVSSEGILTNTTISGNAADYEGGGLYIFSDGTVETANSILWGNTSSTGSEVWNDDGAFTATNSIVGGGIGGGLDADPLFTNPGSEDYTLQATSPAINTGDNSAVPTGVTTDLAGNDRIFDGDTDVVDVGAYEFQGEPFSISPDVDVLKTVTDVNGGSIRPGDTLEYTITVTNRDVEDGDKTINLSLTDVMPDNAIYVAESSELLTTPPTGWPTGPLTDASGDDIAEFSGGELRVNLGVGADANTPGFLDIGESTSLSFRVVVDMDAAGGLIENQATVTFEGETLDDESITVSSHPPETTGPTTVDVDDAIIPSDYNVLYVDQNISGGNGSGNSWANAIPELADALAWAHDEWDGSGSPLQIWVAEGLYLPTGDGSDRSATFQLVNNVQIYGGFNGGEASLSGRDWAANLTILSGDIDGNDATTDGVVTDTNNISGSNSYHVVNGSGTDNTARFDGFIITAGLANGVFGARVGAGMVMFNSRANPVFANLVFSGNSAGTGGGMYNYGNNPTLTNVTFTGNSAVSFGGGMFNRLNSSTLTNVTFSGNRAGSSGGGMFNEESSPTLTNTIIWGNTAQIGSEMFNFDEESIPVISHSLIAGSGGSDIWNSAWGTDGGNNIDADPQFTDPGNGEYTLQNISPAINAGDPATDLSLFPGGPDDPMDLAGNPRVFDGESDMIDIGAYEFQGEPVTIPEQVVLSLPADEAANVGLTPEFSWQSVDGTDEYQLQVSENSDLSDPVIDESGLEETSFEPVSDLDNATMYYWRVRASNAAGDGEWSEIFSFTTLPESSEVVILTDPSDEEDDVSLKPLFEWNPADGADSYYLVVSPNPDFSDPVINEEEIEDTEFQTDDDLDFSTTYYWQVRGMNSGGPGEWSETFRFTTLDQPEAADNRILLANSGSYTFTPGDFGVSDNSFVVVIEDLPGGFNGDLELNETPVSTDDEISVGDIDAGDLVYTPVEDEYGYGYNSFDFSIEDNLGNPSEESYTMSLDVAATSVELTGSEGTSGEGWRFLGNPSDGDSYEGLLDPIWTKGMAGSDSPGATFSNVHLLNQQEYQWEAPADLGNTTEAGQPFIVYVYSDDDNDGTPEGFPKTLTSGEHWDPLDGSFSYNELGYDESPSNNPDNFYLVANPHPISLDFCEFAGTNIATSATFWNPNANGGNGDYEALNCATLEELPIAPFQAFWVRTTDTNPGLAIPETAYLGNAEKGYFKQPDDERSAMSGKDIADLGQNQEDLTGLPNLSGLTLTVQSADGIFTNTARIVFSEEASESLDDWDAPKLSPAGLASRWLSFYSLDEENRGYALQSFPSEALSKDGKITLPLDIQTTEAGAYTLQWNLPESHVLNGSYFLRDNRTGQVMELLEGSSYRFTIEPSQVAKVEDTHPMSELAQNEVVQSVTHRMNSETEPRFELLVAQAGVDGFTELGAVPEQFTLAQNYPNPFNPTTVIRYQLPVNSEVRLEVYDMLGRNVATLINGQVTAGRHTVNFDASGLSSGVYLYRLAAGSTIMTKKLTVVK